MAYKRVQEFFRAIDMSSNRFVGEILDSIGDLKGLNMLNLSNNIFTEHILSSLENLTKLESLDLFQNRLSGEILPQLAQLTFSNGSMFSITISLALYHIGSNLAHSKIVHWREI